MTKALLVLGLVVSIATTEAHAKDKDKKKKATGIERTGIEAFDDVFERVGEIDRLLADAEGQLRSGKQNLNGALELKRGTPLSDAIRELEDRAEGKLAVAMDGAVPKLTTKSAVPTNVQNAVDAVNGLTENLTTTVADLQAIAPEMQGLVKDVQRMPNKLKAEFQKAGGAGLLDMLFKLPKTAKALTHDIEVTVGLTDRTTSLTNKVTDLVDVLRDEFPIAEGSDPAPKPKPKPGNGGGGGGGTGKKKKKKGGYGPK